MESRNARTERDEKKKDNKLNFMAEALRLWTQKTFAAAQKKNNSSYFREETFDSKKCQKKRRLLIKKNPIYVSTHKHTQPFQRDGQAFNQRTDESEGEKLEIRFNKLM